MKNAETLLYNGSIYCSTGSWAEAVAVRDGKILFAGTKGEAGAYINEGTKRIDLKGGFLFPGFIDAHAHPVMAAYFLSGFRLNVNMGEEEILQTVRRYIAEYPEKETYFGHGYAEWIFGEEGPHREKLDAICPDKPVVITGSSGHEGWCNSKALETAGIDRDFPDPVPGFHFFRRDENGDPTGQFMEMGCLSILCEHLDLFDGETVQEGLKKVFDYFSSIGITAIADCGSLPFMEKKGLPMIKKMALDGVLKERVFGCCFVAQPGDELGAIEHLQELHESFYIPGQLQIKTLKIINDGTIESRTASLMEPYCGAERCVRPMLEGEALQSLCLGAAKKGFDVYIHAIGDRAIHETILTAKKIRGTGCLETRITNAHTELVRADDLSAFAEYNITANTTGGWHYGSEEEAASIGARANHLFPLQSILQEGGRMSLGSDFPVDEQGAEPMVSVEIGVTRQLAGEREGLILQPESQRLTVSQMIEGYTGSAAYQLGMETKLGAIKPGMYADFTVLGANPFEADVHNIHKIPVMMTIVGGKITYKKTEHTSL